MGIQTYIGNLLLDFGRHNIFWMVSEFGDNQVDDRKLWICALYTKLVLQDKRGLRAEVDFSLKIGTNFNGSFMDIYLLI